MRKLKLFHDFDRLSPGDLQRVHDSLARSTYRQTMDFLREQFGIEITYGRLQRYYHHWQQTLLLKAQAGISIAVNDYIRFQNGEALPHAYSALAQHLIQKAACIQAANPDNHTPARLLTLQRIANNPFNQHLAAEKLELEKRRQVLRERQLIHRAWCVAQQLLFARSQTLSTTNLAPAIQPLPHHANILPANFSAPAQTLLFPNPATTFARLNTA